MGIIIDIKVTPSSGRSTFCLDASGKLKAYLKSPPEGGKANTELIRLFSKALRCPQASLSIVSGATTRTKRIKIHLSLTRDEVLSKLGVAVQTRLI